MYLLDGAAGGWGGWRGNAYPYGVLGYAVLRCATLCYAALRHGVGIPYHTIGVGVGVMRISGRRFVALLAWRVSKR